MFVFVYAIVIVFVFMFVIVFVVVLFCVHLQEVPETIAVLVVVGDLHGSRLEFVAVLYKLSHLHVRMCTCMHMWVILGFSARII